MGCGLGRAWACCWLLVLVPLALARPLQGYGPGFRCLALTSERDPSLGALGQGGRTAM